MWWIFLIVLAILILFYIAIYALIHISKNKKENKHLGTQVGGDKKISFFLNNEDKAGIEGEKCVNYYLRRLLKEDEYLLGNVLIPLKNGYNTEIDSVLITRKGIFCIEIKNWVGRVKGNDDDTYWYQEYDDPNVQNKRHRNPVIQNQRHVVVLTRKLKNEFNIHNVVIFPTLEIGSIIDSNYSFTIDEFIKYYNHLDNELSISDVNKAFYVLVKYVATPRELERNKKEMKRRFN